MTFLLWWETVHLFDPSPPPSHHQSWKAPALKLGRRTVMCTLVVDGCTIFLCFCFCGEGEWHPPPFNKLAPKGFYYLPSLWRTTGLPVTYFSGHVYVTLFSCFCNIVPIFRHFYVLFCDSFVIFLHFSWLFCWFAVTFLPAHKTAISSLIILTWLLLFSSLCFVFDQNISYFISQMHAVSYYQAYMFTCPLCFSSLFMYIS